MNCRLDVRRAWTFAAEVRQWAQMLGLPLRSLRCLALVSAVTIGAATLARAQADTTSPPPQPGELPPSAPPPAPAAIQPLPGTAIGPAPYPATAPAPLVYSATDAQRVGVSAAPERAPFYQRWWFWTAVGAFAVTAVVIIAASSGPTTPRTDFGNMPAF